MATYTPNLNLKKPATSDNINVNDINSNMDKIDTYCKDLHDYKYAGTLPTNTDLNDAVDPGFYLLSMNFTYTNLPPQQAYSMLILRPSTTANVVVQIGIGTEYIYYRMRTSATNWDSWHKFDLFGRGWIAGCDLNTLTEPGTYGISSNNTYQHLPTGEGAGILEVIAPTSGATYITQRLNIVDRFYVRYKYLSSGASWGPWYKFTGTYIG